MSKAFVCDTGILRKNAPLSAQHQERRQAGEEESYSHCPPGAHFRQVGEGVHLGCQLAPGAWPLHFACSCSARSLHCYRNRWPATARPTHALLRISFSLGEHFEESIGLHVSDCTVPVKVEAPHS